MHRNTLDAPKTTGSVIRTGGIHGARLYDLFGRILSFGRDKAIREQLIALAAPAPAEKVLDVGCGTGALGLAVKSRIGPGEVHGIDASPGMIEVAKEKAVKARAQVDLKAAGLREIRRVLKPGGRFMAVDFAAHSHSPLGHLLSILSHSRGESMVEKLTPMLGNAAFSDITGVPTRHKNFAFIRARRPIPSGGLT